ncbi:MAG: DinB family protein [Nitrospinota bacterium]|nr:DinB family protein [Nitrospinota bacterium]MDH5677501.1 DinB family protein [Nitrospinota bacterium]MDH5756933.1 DinB family protein [Nitrospinota bacterium]
MSELEIYLQKHSLLVEQLAQAAENIPPGKEDWRPCPSALPWLRLVDHMSIARRHLILPAVKGEEFDFPACQRDPANQATTVEQAARAQRESWEELKTFLDSQPETYMDSVVGFTRGRQWPVSQVLWFGFEENLHHRGQLWIYFRVNGLVPPKVWGTEGMIE